MQKVIFVICDGLPDRPIEALGNKTPLEVAKTPNLDKLAIDGISGMMHLIGPGIRPGSDTAHLALFGYDPYVYYSGRGPFECLGIDMEIKPGDICFRANAGTLDDNGILIDRRVNRIESTAPVVDLLDGLEIDGVKFIMKPGLSHRIGLIARGQNLSHRVSDQDPHITGTKVYKVRPLDETPEAIFTAEVLNKFSDLAINKLKDAPFNITRKKAGLLPANTVLFRGAGVFPKDLMAFTKKYRLKAAFVAGAPFYRGIAKFVGMDIISFSPEDGVTGLPNSNIKRKIEKAIKISQNYDIVFVHIKAADSLSEDGNYQGKIEFIEKLDQALLPLAEAKDFLVVVTADHTTACQLKLHTADPVPLTIRGEGVRTDDINAYSERECARGRLGTITGANLMPIIVDLMGLAELFGA